MDALKQAVTFLLTECVESVGQKYADYVDRVGSLEEDDGLHEILKEERDRLGGKLARAKAYLQCLEMETKKA